MPSAGFLFSTVFRFRKVTQERFLELHRTKTPSIFSHHVHGDRRRDGGEPRGPHTTWRRGSPPVRGEVVWGPQASPGVSPSPIYTSSSENPKYPIKHPRKVPSPPSSSTLDREGSGALPGTLPERRSSPEGSTSPCLPLV